MVAIPQQLFQKATACGFVCTPSDIGEHRITPQEPHAGWQLMCQKECWLLIVHGSPQIRFRYPEVVSFIERTAHGRWRSTGDRQPSVPLLTPNQIRRSRSLAQSVNAR
jgi:hypothetical protein